MGGGEDDKGPDSARFASEKYIRTALRTSVGSACSEPLVNVTGLPDRRQLMDFANR